MVLAVIVSSFSRSIMAMSLPRQDHVYKTIDESFRFHNTNFDVMRCKLDSAIPNPTFSLFFSERGGGAILFRLSFCLF